MSPFFRRRKRPTGRPEDYWRHTDLPLRNDEQNPIAEMMAHWDGPLLHKWEHYSRHYHDHFQAFRNQPDLRFLELGVFKGGSLTMWQKYFGDQASICGIDVDPVCAELPLAPDLDVVIGSQDDPATLEAAFDKLGGPPDIIVDDGSHTSPHVRASFQWIWPRMAPGSLYVIEDLHASYWSDFDGAYAQPHTSIGLIQGLVDDLHETHHTFGHRHARGLEIGGIHIYDSIAFIEKATRQPPRACRIQPA